MSKVVVIGAGLTGLSVAYHLEKNNFFDYKIFEKNSLPGGLLRSVKHDGFTFDYTGHLLHISSPYFFDFLNEIAGLQHFDLITRKSSIFSNNVLTNYPFQINLKGLSAQVIYECIDGFIKRKKSIHSPKNFHEWVLKYFGSGIGKHFLFPYNKKMQNYDLKKITPDWTGRFVPKTDLKNIIFGAIESDPKTKIGYNAQFYYPKKDGIQFLINKLSQKITNHIYTDHEVEFIDLMKKTIYFTNGYAQRFEKLITTMPLDNFLKSLNDQNLNKASKNLLCNSVLNFNIGFNKSDISNNHWIYFPEKQFNFYRVGFWNNISENSVPKNCSGIYGEVSYNKNLIKIKLKSILDKSTEQALKFLNLNSSNIVTKNILNIEHAYVIYDKWRQQNLNKVLNQLKVFNINSIGRYGAWKYSSMQEAVLDAKTTVDDILKLKQTKKSLTVMPAAEFNINKSSYLFVAKKGLRRDKRNLKGVRGNEATK
ncbi:MAG: NAD(P)-binding protein [bacterium]